MLAVHDPLGFADGSWAVRIDESGEAMVAPAGDDAPDVELSVGALSSLLLGGVRATELAAAGTVLGDAEALAALDGAFTPEATPLLDIWY
ncbi:sterol carrier protein domain-containing protein [Microbacterium sp. CFBP 8794]|nr:sterol carrier protein domain-containing protein [Microbacterium sp. CFBP 8794]